jgi:Leucine-rich repeat (LRR) protein
MIIRTSAQWQDERTLVERFDALRIILFGENSHSLKAQGLNESVTKPQLALRHRLQPFLLPLFEKYANLLWLQLPAVTFNRDYMIIGDLRPEWQYRHQVTTSDNLKILQCHEDYLIGYDVDHDTICLPALQYLDVSGSDNDKSYFYALALSLKLAGSSRGVIRSLTRLELRRCRYLYSLPELKHSPLKYLDVSHCPRLRELPEINCSTLQHLNLSGCKVLRVLPNLNNSVLQYLDMSDCRVLTGLPDLSCIAYLTVLNLSNCTSIFDILDVRDVSFPTSLQHLNLDNTYITVISQLNKLKSLQTLTAQHCRHLNTLDVTSLKMLQVLKLCACDHLETLVGLETLTAVVDFDVHDCVMLISALDFTGSVMLQRVDCSYCTALTVVHGINTLHDLIYLDLEKCGRLSGILCLEGLTALKELNVSGCSSLERIQGVDTLVSIERLIMTEIVAHQMPTSIGPAVRAKLRALSLSSYDQLAALQHGGILSALEYLMIKSTDEVTTLDVSGMPALVQLYVKDCKKLETVLGLDITSHLKVLWLQDCLQLQQLPHVAARSNLSQLILSGCVNLNSMSDKLTEFSTLKVLHLQGCGIGQMISEQTNSQSQQQIDEVLSRPGFSYTTYEGACRYGRGLRSD